MTVRWSGPTMVRFGVCPKRGARISRHSIRGAPCRVTALGAAAASYSMEKPLDVTAFANTGPQNFELGVYAGPPSTTEDCLYLNVFTTNIGRGADHNRREKVPVMLW